MRMLPSASAGATRVRSGLLIDAFNKGSHAPFQINPSTSLHDLVEEAAPSGPCGHLGSERVDLLPVMLTTTSIDINLVNRDPTLSLPDISDGPEEENNGKGQV